MDQSDVTRVLIHTFNGLNKSYYLNNSTNSVDMLIRRGSNSLGEVCISALRNNHQLMVF